MENRNFKSFYFDTIAAITGELAIDTVILALESLERLKVVRNFGKTENFGGDDYKGIDIIIYPFWGGRIWLQVKSSFNLRDKKRYNGRGIFYLAIPPKMEVYNVESRVSGILARVYEQRVKKKNRKMKSFSG